MKKSIQAFLTTTAIAVAAAFSSCDTIFEDQGDCSVRYRVPFTYTQNILDSDAFAKQVTSVTLYVFDSDGRLAFTKTESGEALASPGYAMNVELKPGRYSMVAWCEGTPAYSPSTSFEIGGGGHPAADTDLTATLPLKGTEGAYYSDLDIAPLFYGYAAGVDCPNTYGLITLPAIDLTKDTNVINVAVENLDGTEIETGDITVSIEATNSFLDWRNNLSGDLPFLYRPWSVTSISSDRSGRADDNAETDPVTGIFAEMTVGRLMVDRKPILVVHRTEDDKDIIRLDLIKYLCMVKGHYAGGYSDQEYLDRMDRHTLTFFVDASLNWYTALGININGWKVVPPQDMEL